MKKVLLYLLCLVTCVSLSACKGDKPEAKSDKSTEEKAEEKADQTEENQSEEEDSKTSDNEFEVNTVVFEGGLIDLKCLKITKQGMEFECTNKSDKDISVYLTISLDGYVTGLWSDTTEGEVGAGETAVLPLHGSLDYAEHKIMSIYGNVFVDQVGAELIDICDFDIGGRANPEGDTTGFAPLYANDNIDVKYAGADAQGLVFTVENKRDRAIDVYMDKMTIEGQPDDIVLTASNVPAHTVGLYNLDIYSYNPDYFPDDITAFDGVMFTQLSSGGNGDRFRLTLTPEAE